MAEFKSMFAPEGSAFKSRFDAKPEEEPETTFGGILESAGAGVAAGFTAPGRYAGAGLEVFEDITGINLFGEELTDVSKFAQSFWQKRIGKSKAESLIGQAAETLGTIGSSLAVVAATGGALGVSGAATFAGGAKAAAGGNALLYSLSAGAGLDKTATERRAGTPVLNAYGAGIVTAATEYITEKIPLGQLQKIGNKFFRRLVTGAISDIGGEMLATAIELSVVDKRILGKDHHLTQEQYWDILKETAAVALISTAGMSVGAKALQLTGETVDAQNAITPPPNPLLLPPKEKVESTAIGEAVRSDSKSEFPEHSSQVDPVSPDVNLELNPSTSEDVKVVDKPPIDRPLTTYEETQDKARAYSYKKRKLTTGKVWKAFIRGWVDVSGNLQDALSKLGPEGNLVVLKQNAINGASSEATKHIDRIHKEVYSGLNQNERHLFDDWKSALRDLELRRARGTQFKLKEGHTEQSINDFLDRIPARYLEDSSHPEGKGTFVIRSDAYKKGMDDLLVLGFKEGLLTEAQLGYLREAGGEYLPREVLDFIDPPVQRRNKQGNIITVRDSGLMSLTEHGTERLLETDTQLLMEQAQQRMWTRVYRNRAALELQRLAQVNPDAASIVRENKVIDATKEVYEYTNKKGKSVNISVKNVKELNAKLKNKDVTNIRKIKSAKPIFQTISADEMRISVMENGIRKELVMPVELGSEWITGDPILSATMANIISTVSGNKILKAMATTLNPEFAITNVPRDMSHIWMTTEEYSSFAPLAVLQIHIDVAAVLKDFKYWDNLYIENGGGMEFLSLQGKAKLKGTTAVTHGLSKLQDVMSVAGTFSEKITRFALTRRAMRNGKSPFEATQIARGYLDFSRGGSVSKMINSAVPFFNAGIQATRGIVRAAKNNPMIFGAKAFQVGAMALGLYYANKKMYPEDYDDVPDYEKENNFIILTPMTYLDKDGSERRRYFRIPKDQGQKVFSTIFENMARRSEGEQVDAIKITNIVRDYLPIIPGEILPPVIEMMLGYSVNKDFWLRKDIWTGPPVLPQEEYNKYTPKAYVQAGKLTGMSPERLRYATKQLFTSGNIWTSLVGFGVEEVMKELSPSERERVSEMTLDQIPGIRRLMRSTRPDTALRKKVKQQKIEINTERLIRNREFDALADRFLDGNTDAKEVIEYLRRTPIIERKRLQRRFKIRHKLKDIPNRSFWFALSELPPEARAVNYWNKWVQLDELARNELDRQSVKVPGFRTKRFNIRFNKMRRFGKQGGR